MFLRAEHVSVYFPGVALPDSGQHEPAQVGGILGTWRGRRAVRALDKVSLSLGDGDRLGVVGHNGSGKSTLLRALAGIYIPQEGRVAASGPVSGIFNVSIGFRQEASGYRNILLKGLMAGRTHAEIERAIPAIQAFTELGDFLHAPLRTYSQGMALRLAFATTTAFTHEILVMDEWIGAGDGRFQEKVVAHMNSLFERTRICVVASHHHGLLRRITDRCIWLDAGRIRASGPTLEVLEAYDEELRSRPGDEREPVFFREPIPEGFEALRVVLVDPARPQSPAVVTWNVERFGVLQAEVHLVDGAQGKEKLVFSGRGSDSRKTGPWVRPGMVFRLRDGRDGELLAEVRAA